LTAPCCAFPQSIFEIASVAANSNSVPQSRHNIPEPNQQLTEKNSPYFDPGDLLALAGYDAKRAVCIRAIEIVQWDREHGQTFPDQETFEDTRQSA
jgi:hypothetical protein